METNHKTTNVEFDDGKCNGLHLNKRIQKGGIRKNMRKHEGQKIQRDRWKFFSPCNQIAYCKKYTTESGRI